MQVKHIIHHEIITDDGLTVEEGTKIYDAHYGYIGKFAGFKYDGAEPMLAVIDPDKAHRDMDNENLFHFASAERWTLDLKPLISGDDPETLKTMVRNGLARLRDDWGLDRAPNPALDHPLHHLVALAARDSLYTNDLVKMESTKAALEKLGIATTPYVPLDDESPF